MAIDSELCFAGPFVGNGSRTDYDYPFYIDNPAHLLVEKNDTPLAYGTEYSVNMLPKAVPYNSIFRWNSVADSPSASTSRLRRRPI